VARTLGSSAKGGPASGGQPCNTNMFYVYILQSLKDLGYYIGITDSLEKRLREHNNGKTKSTKSRIPFVIKYTELFKNKTEARKREIELKKNYYLRKELLNSIGFNLK
jgi:putative endonuclease